MPRGWLASVRAHPLRKVWADCSLDYRRLINVTQHGFVRTAVLPERELRVALEDYRNAARTLPFGVSHFGLRYASEDALLAAADRVRSKLAQKLGERLQLRVFDPRDGELAGATVVQGFAYQDAIVSGSFNYGQLIELQSPPP